MSYILDALKKAERERDIRQVPTLMAEHEPAAKDRKSRYAVYGALVICVGAIIWFILFLQRTMSPPEPSLTTGEYSRSDGKVKAPHSEEPASPAATAAKPETSGEKSAGAPPVPRAIVPAGTRDFPCAQRNGRRTPDSSWLNRWLQRTGRTVRIREIILNLPRQNGRPREYPNRGAPQKQKCPPPGNPKKNQYP